MEHNTAIFDSSKSRYGYLGDLVTIRPTSVIVTEDETTPDFLRPLIPDTISEAGSTLIRRDRAMLNLDEGWVTQTMKRTTRPREYTFQNATFLPEGLRFSDPDNPDVEMLGLNAQGIGAIARWQDCFRISIAEGRDDELPKIALAANLAYHADDPDKLWWLLYAVLWGEFLASGGTYIRGGSGTLSRRLVSVVEDEGGGHPSPRRG